MINIKKSTKILPLAMLLLLAMGSTQAYAQLQRKPLPPPSGGGELPPLENPGPLPDGPMSSSSDSFADSPGMQKFGEAVGEATKTGIDVAVQSMREWGVDCKRLDLAAMYDAHIEGPAFGLQFRTPFMFGIFARVGYNTHYDEQIYNLRKVRWTAGLQLWLKNWNIIEIGVGETYYKKLGDTSYGLSLAMGYSQKIYKGLGIDGALGAALSFKTDGNDGAPYIKFIWRVGLVYRFVFL